MNQKRIFWIILLFLIASLDVSMARQLQQSYGIQKQESQLANEEEAFATLRAFELPPDAYRQLAGKEEASESANDKQQKELHENILAYLFCQSLQSSDLKDWKRLEKSARPGLYADYTEIVKKLLADAVWFPVPLWELKMPLHRLPQVEAQHIHRPAQAVERGANHSLHRSPPTAPWLQCPSAPYQRCRPPGT